MLTSVDEVTKRRADALRGLWIVLIAVYTVLVLTNSIAGFATLIYILFTIAVMAADQLLRRRLRRA